MDIKTVFGINQAYGQNRVGRGDSGESSSVARGKGSESERSSGSADRVTLSDDARLVSVATRSAQEAPESRADKVAALKAQVDAGTYQPDSKKIAEKLLTMESELFG
ncbi:flagellar biosynthesis anti-sigma factor FlgM [Solidesulfovibrio sp.]